MTHPLDRPVWTALTTRQASLAQSAGGALRYHPAFGPFAASADGSPESLAQLATLVPEGGHVYLQQIGEMAAPPGLAIVRSAMTVQMVAEQILGPQANFGFQRLTQDDAADMLALARETQPGPFAERTHELGDFVGVRRDGKLVAMAGERMKPERYTEVSGVCTLPEHRGKGYAAGLMREVARAILARGEVPFLHAFADNIGAIRLYEQLGFVTRHRSQVIVLQRI